jgi:dolichol-phosphate mannosyltransferase
VRSVLSIGQVKDCTGGFRAIRASYLEMLDLTELHAKGYGFQISLLSALKALGAKIVEVPIHFADRKIGTSKMRLSDQLEFVAITFRLRSQRTAALLRPKRASTRASAAKVSRKS